jgi:C1A family cysteine protease
MKVLILAILALGISCEMLVTKEYVDYLKKHVDWKVMEYEENPFRGWTLEEAQMFLGATPPETMEYIPEAPIKENLPSTLDWATADCDHGVKDQARCGSCWAFATVGMLASRCCLQGHDHGWLSTQMLVSCDKKSSGCRGGWCTWALDYVMSAKGLPVEACFPYKAADLPCPSKCVDGSEIKRYCNCVGGYKMCTSVAAIKTAMGSGPVTLAFEVYQDFFNYKEGIYHHKSGTLAGLHAVLGMGYSDTPEPHYRVRNSWGTSWGMKGYFLIGVNECGISGKYPNGNVYCEKVEP